MTQKPLFIHYKLTDVIRIHKIVTMHYFEFDRNFSFAGERHDFWELVYVDSGVVNITAGKAKHTLNRGELIFHKPNEFHTISAATAANVFVISFVTMLSSSCLCFSLPYYNTVCPNTQSFICTSILTNFV